MTGGVCEGLPSKELSAVTWLRRQDRAPWEPRRGWVSLEASWAGDGGAAWPQGMAESSSRLTGIWAQLQSL